MHCVLNNSASLEELELNNHGHPRKETPGDFSLSLNPSELGKISQPNHALKEIDTKSSIGGAHRGKFTA